MFELTARTPDGTFKIVATFADESSARDGLATHQKLYPAIPFGLTWPANFLNGWVAWKSVS